MEGVANGCIMPNDSRGIIRTAVATLLLCLIGFAQKTSPPATDLPGASRLHLAIRKLNVHTALLVKSQAVDEIPVWSPDSRYLAVNIEGRSYKLDTWAVGGLQGAKWHGMGVGTVRHELQRSDATVAEVNTWKGESQNNPREAVAKSGVKVQLSQRDLSTAFIISKENRTKTLWNSVMEN
jgi:hypothetical protein